MFRAPEESTEGSQGAEGVEIRVGIAPGRGTFCDAKSGCKVRSSLPPDSRLRLCALGVPDALGAHGAKYYFC